MKSLVRLGTLLFAAALAACSSSPEVSSYFDTNNDFTKYQSFGFYSEKMPQSGEYTSIAEKYFIRSVTDELESRGMKRAAPGDDGDLMIAFNVSAKEKIQTYEVPASGAAVGVGYGYYGYRGYYGYGMPVYATETRVKQYTEGTLTIDLVDGERKQVVWEGVAIGRMKGSLPKDADVKIRQLVADMFKDYPIGKAGSQPAP